MIEYVILILMVATALFGVIGATVGAMGSFYMNIIKVIVLPFP